LLPNQSVQPIIIAAHRFWNDNSFQKKHRVRNKKWPIVPPPLPLECISSWLHRVAKQYGLTAAQLVNNLLKEDHPQLRISLIETLDSFAPPVILQLLSNASGLDHQRLRRMTLAQYVPHVAEHDGEPLFRRFSFSQYIRGFSLLPPQWLPESIEPLLPWDRLTVAKDMPVCMSCLRSDHLLHTKLTWRFNIVASCPWHGSQIQPMRVFTRTLDQWDYFEDPERFKPHPCLDILDGITNRLFHYGSCEVSGGVAVSARWWMRCLRGMGEEVRRVAMLHDHGIAIPTEFEKVFEQFGRPSREVLTLQHPLEEMSPFDTAQIWICVGALFCKLLSGKVAPYYEGSRLGVLHGLASGPDHPLVEPSVTQAIGA